MYYSLRVTLMQRLLYVLVQPTSKNPQEVLNDFQNISQSTTYSQVVNFVEKDFTGEGQELEAITLSNVNANPPFLNNVTAALPKAFAQTVHGFWTQLIRTTNASALCGSSGKCESSLIPLNHTFIIPGNCCPTRLKRSRTALFI